MNRKSLLIGAVSAAWATVLMGQVFSFQQPGTFAPAGATPLSGGVWHRQDWISGKPFSAQVRLHVAQTVGGAPSLQIDHTETGLVFRDVQGRTRRETIAKSGNLETREVSIIDPNANVEHDFTVAEPGSSGRYTERTAQLDVSNVIREEPYSAYQLAQQEDQERKARQMAKSGNPAHEPARRNIEDLGTRTINGIMAQGVRIVTTIPAGAIGNNEDLVVSTEHWVSPELHVLVKSVYSDPRFGTTTYELTNIQRTNPDPSLFQVPAGYEERRHKKKGGGGGGGVQGFPVHKDPKGADGKQP